MWWLDKEAFKQEDDSKKKNQGCPAMGVPADEEGEKKDEKTNEP